MNVRLGIITTMAERFIPPTHCLARQNAEGPNGKRPPLSACLFYKIGKQKRRSLRSVCVDFASLGKALPIATRLSRACEPNVSVRTLT